MIGKFSINRNGSSSGSASGSAGASGSSANIPLPILEEDVHLQQTYETMGLLFTPRERGTVVSPDVYRQKDFNEKLLEDLYLEEIFWGVIEIDTDYNFNPTDKKDKFFGRTIIVNREGTLTIPTNRAFRILKRSDDSQKLTIRTIYGQEKEYIGSPAGTIFLVSPVFSSGTPCISEIRPTSFHDFGIN